MKITTNKISGLIIGLSLVVSGITGCGQNSDQKIRKGFYLNSNALLSVNKVEANVDNSFLGSAIDKFQEVYGSCGKEVFIELKEYSFYSEDLKAMVSGLSYNNGGSCNVKVGVNPKSNCETAQVLWHELYHCCKDVSSHDGWVYDIFDMRDAWEQDGGCTSQN